MDADEAYFKEHGEPLFSSHMIDLSEEEKDWNLETTAKYLKRAAPMKQWLEMVGDIFCSLRAQQVQELIQIHRRLVLLVVKKMVSTTKRLITTRFTLSPKIFTISTRRCLPLALISQLLPDLEMFMVSTNPATSSSTRSSLENIKNTSRTRLMGRRTSRSFWFSTVAQVPRSRST